MTRTTKRRTIIVSKHGHRHGKVTWSESVSRVTGFASLKHEREVPCREIRIVSHRFQFFKKKVRKKSSRQPQVTGTIYTGPVVLPLSKNASWLRCCNTTVSTGFETQTQNDERPVRGQTLREGEVHENRRKGRSENRRDLVCLKALRSENRSMEGVHTQSTEVVGS